VKAVPCSRPLSEQAEDESGSRRRGDHQLRRLDLLSDEELDSYRARFGSAALDAADVLADAMETQAAQIQDLARGVLESRTDQRPVLGIFVCVSCGTHEVARTKRPWAVDRAMRRSGLPEREVRAALALLTEAEGDDHDALDALDGLDGDLLRELRGLVGQDVDVDSVRARYGRARSSSSRAAGPSQIRALGRQLLVVDDHPLTRRSLAGAGRVLGYACAEAASTLEALAVLARRNFTAVIVDYELMDGTTGLDLLETVREQRPGALRVLMSGNPPSGIHLAMEGGLVHRFLSKPFDLDALRTILNAGDEL
jgi:CheY-like chemotaxis protein